MEQEMKDMPVHVVNGFSFREESARLMGYALDIVRLGGKIEPSFWDDHIIENHQEHDFINTMHISGPVIRRAHFDIFESLEQCRKNAHTLLEALIYGFDLMQQELRESFCSEDSVSPLILRHRENMFSRELRMYLTRPADQADIQAACAYRRQAIALCDAEPVLLRIFGNDGQQYVWNGEWRALLSQSQEVRNRHYQTWLYNHALTEHRLKNMVSRYLHHKFPEHFGDKNA